MTAPAPLEATPYEKHLLAKLREWQAKHPERAAMLRQEVALLSGAPRLHRLSEQWVDEMLAPSMAAVLRAVYGWPTAEEWKP